MAKPRPTAAELAASLFQGHPGNPQGKSQDLAPSGALEDTTLFLSPDDIDLYDDNPRQAPNPAEAEIRASLVARGFDGELAVTRRPQSTRYVVSAGGNTLLRLIKEHLAEGDARFAQIRCRAKPWVSETRVLLDHMIENDARGELIFIDKARSVARARQRLEAELGESLSGRRLAETLTERGYKIDQPTITRYDYAIEMTAYLPETFAGGAGHGLIRELRKIDKAIEALCRSRRQEEQTDIALSTWRAHLAEHDSPDRGALDTDRALQDHCESLAALLDESLQDTRMDLFTLLNNPAYERIATENAPPRLSERGAFDDLDGDSPEPERRRAASPVSPAAGGRSAVDDNFDMFGFDAADEGGAGDDGAGDDGEAYGNGDDLTSTSMPMAPARPTPVAGSPFMTPSTPLASIATPSPFASPPPSSQPGPLIIEADTFLFDSLKEARAKMFTAALALANATGLGPLIQPTGNAGMGYFIEVPAQSLVSAGLGSHPSDPAPAAWWWMFVMSNVRNAQADPGLVRVLSRSHFWELTHGGRDLTTLDGVVGEPMVIEELHDWVYKLHRHARLASNLLAIWSQMLANAPRPGDPGYDAVPPTATASTEL